MVYWNDIHEHKLTQCNNTEESKIEKDSKEGMTLKAILYLKPQFKGFR